MTGDVFQHLVQVILGIEAIELGCLCRPSDYAERFLNDTWLSRCCRLLRGRWLRTVRH